MNYDKLYKLNYIQFIKKKLKLSLTVVNFQILSFYLLIGLSSQTDWRKVIAKLSSANIYATQPSLSDECQIELINELEQILQCGFDRAGEVSQALEDLPIDVSVEEVYGLLCGYMKDIKRCYERLKVIISIYNMIILLYLTT